MTERAEATAPFHANRRCCEGKPQSTCGHSAGTSSVNVFCASTKIFCARDQRALAQLQLVAHFFESPYGLWEILNRLGSFLPSHIHSVCAGEFDET
jgi:hypothetical protein